MDEKLRAQLLRDECVGGKPSLVSYKDSRGFWTIGIGHLLGPRRRMTDITPAEADALYAYDVEEATALARDCVPLFANLDQGRQRALINMAFNRGNHMRDSSTITPAINLAAADGSWQRMAVPINKSTWAAQVGARAIRIRDTLLTGVD